jgi:hypothetical protein
MIFGYLWLHHKFNMICDPFSAARERSWRMLVGHTVSRYSHQQFEVPSGYLTVCHGKSTHF